MNEEIKLNKAISNNNDLYKSILSSKKIQFEINDDIAYSTQKLIPLYSNIITRSKNWKPDSRFKEINNYSISEKWENWTIKDSFNTLNLNKSGFKKLLEMNWIYLKYNTISKGNESKIYYIKIQSLKELNLWRKKWSKGEEDSSIAKIIFEDKLLENNELSFILGFQDEIITCGCLLNISEDVIGISNFFINEEKLESWKELVNFIFKKYPKLDIVGYEDKNTLEIVSKIGFENIGALTVWIKNN